MLDSLVKLETNRKIGELVVKQINGKVSDESLRPERIIYDIENYIKGHFITNEMYIRRISLWIYATYFHKQIDTLPILLITGPIGTGKSTLVDVIEILAFNSKDATTILSDALLKLVSDGNDGTLIFDEFERMPSLESEEIEAWLEKGDLPNEGYAKAFSLFGPKVISTYDEVPRIIADHSVRVNLQKVRSNEIDTLNSPSHAKGLEIAARAALSTYLYKDTVNQLMEEDKKVFSNPTRSQLNHRPLVIMEMLIKATNGDVNLG